MRGTSSSGAGNLVDGYNDLLVRIVATAERIDGRRHAARAHDPHMRRDAPQLFADDLAYLIDAVGVICPGDNSSINY
jgi:hypothetical protein